MQIHMTQLEAKIDRKKEHCVLSMWIFQCRCHPPIYNLLFVSSTQLFPSSACWTAIALHLKPLYSWIKSRQWVATAGQTQTILNWIPVRPNWLKDCSWGPNGRHFFRWAQVLTHQHHHDFFKLVRLNWVQITGGYLNLQWGTSASLLAVRVITNAVHVLMTPSDLTNFSLL